MDGRKLLREEVQRHGLLSINVLNGMYHRTPARHTVVNHTEFLDFTS